MSKLLNMTIPTQCLFMWFKTSFNLLLSLLFLLLKGEWNPMSRSSLALLPIRRVYKYTVQTVYDQGHRGGNPCLFQLSLTQLKEVEFQDIFTVYTSRKVSLNNIKSVTWLLNKICWIVELNKGCCQWCWINILTPIDF